MRLKEVCKAKKAEKETKPDPAAYADDTGPVKEAVAASVLG